MCAPGVWRRLIALREAPIPDFGKKNERNTHPPPIAPNVLLVHKQARIRTGSEPDLWCLSTQRLTSRAHAVRFAVSHAALRSVIRRLQRGTSEQVGIRRREPGIESTRAPFLDRLEPLWFQCLVRSIEQ